MLLFFPLIGYYDEFETDALQTGFDAYDNNCQARSFNVVLVVYGVMMILTVMKMHQ
jgi:hypothetical protein